MKSLLAILLIATLYSASCAAEEKASRNLQLGFGTYAISIVYDDIFAQDDKLSGVALALRIALNNNVALHGNMYFTEHEDVSAIDNNGTDILVLFGNNMQLLGFKAYLGAGFFNETWKGLSSEADFNGVQFAGGLGYNWNNVAVDFLLSLRDASDYEDFIYAGSRYSPNAASASGALILSLRF